MQTQTQTRMQSSTVDRVTFVVWFQLGEFLLWEPRPISESGRPLPFVGEAVGVLLMRSGETCIHEGQHKLHCLLRVSTGRLTASLRDMIAMCEQQLQGECLATRNVCQEWGQLRRGDARAGG